MDIARLLLTKIEDEGVKLEDRQDVYNSLDRAILDGRFAFIMDGDERAGFYTWERQESKIFVNNLLVFRKNRGRVNLLKIRGELRKANNAIGAFEWVSRKRKKLVNFKQREVIC